MSFAVDPATVMAPGSTTAAGTGARKRSTRILLDGAIVASFTMPASGKFTRSIPVAGPERVAQVVLKQLRMDGVWAQTASTELHVLLAASNGNGGTVPEPPNPPPAGVPPVVSNVVGTVLGQTSARVTCSTADSATVIVEYGTSTAYGSQTAATASGTSHSRDLVGLQPGTLYHYRVRATDADGTTVDQDRTFQTPTPPPPPSGGYPPDGVLTNPAINQDTVPRPAHLASIIDPTFGTRITRITGIAGYRHPYSKRCPWNFGGGRFSVWKDQGAKPMQLLDATTWALIREVDAANEFLWSNTDPDKMFGFNGGTNQFISLNVNTGVRTILHAFAGYSTINIGGGEGSLSYDDKYVLLHAPGENTLILYRIDTDQVIATKSLAALPDNSTVSPTGAFCVLSWEGSSSGGQSGVEVWTPSGDTLVFQRRLVGTGVHGQVGYDQSGNEVWAQMSHYSGGNYTGEQWGVVPMYRLDTGARTNLFSVATAYGAGNIAAAPERPGWFYLSTYTRSPGYPGSDQLGAVQADGSGTFEAFGFEHHLIYPSYFVEPPAVPNRDGKKLAFATEWAPNVGPVFDYVAEWP